MQLDMANFTIQVSKPDIIANSVELERRKFADYLAVQAGNEIIDKILFKLLFVILTHRWSADYKKMAVKTL